ncbi:alpha/beta fold hydrolase [Marinomonas sp. 15G1-11]|uniref:Alpha/beta fold hydrolase n=1 Tax=Marinomonas phaeophyticola TaxID=3004091 RepID=A0ABT4K0H7_9GAMM|nr:alpha/beta fold hydrolase [Marinomonas sp. 15G1-11]MCZ2723284.1 alpha/beta fold hydrolase [Marinomonas sp. 15G1-11]
MRFQLEYICLGEQDNQAIFMIPGWGMPKESMLPLATALSEQFYVVLVDLPGITANSNSLQLSRLGINYDIDVLTEQFLEIAPESSWWLGWSLGGAIATYVAARRSSRVKGLITLATSPCFVKRNDWALGMDLPTFDEFSQLVHTSPELGLRRFISLQTKGAQHSRLLQKQLIEYVNPEAFNGLALDGGLRLLRNLDVRREYALLDCRNLHLYGQEDILVPFKVLSKLHQISDKQKIEVIEGCSHQPFLEQPEKSKNIIEQFIYGT